MSKGRKDKRYILQRIRMRAAEKAMRKRNNRRKYKVHQKPNTHSFVIPKDTKPIIDVPRDFRLIDNRETCLEFFRLLRNDNAISIYRNRRFVRITLKDVQQMDYAAISVLTAISDELKSNGITIAGDFPRDEDCKQFILESGFLNHMYDENNRPFPKSEKSEMIFFEKGCGTLSEDDNRKISNIVKNVVGHLTGVPKHNQSIKTILLEICGNSIEWSGTKNKQWLLGVKYDNNKVTFTVVDVGKGILETLYRKFGRRAKDFLTLKTEADVLLGAFDKKYGSTTQQVNRNKGLPSVKANYQDGKIKNLIVLTNNVILHFANQEKTKTFANKSPRFKGTFYQWEMDSNCINNKNL